MTAQGRQVHAVVSLDTRQPRELSMSSWKRLWAGPRLVGLPRSQGLQITVCTCMHVGGVWAKLSTWPGVKDTPQSSRVLQ
jgi:hypothetical protein